MRPNLPSSFCWRSLWSRLSAITTCLCLTASLTPPHPINATTLLGRTPPPAQTLPARYCPPPPPTQGMPIEPCGQTALGFSCRNRQGTGSHTLEFKIYYYSFEEGITCLRCQHEPTACVCSYVLLFSFLFSLITVCRIPYSIFRILPSSSSSPVRVRSAPWCRGDIIKLYSSFEPPFDMRMHS